MAIVGSAELTAAVSKAGGVGLFCLGRCELAMLADEIDSIRRLSSAPFGVDFIVDWLRSCNDRRPCRGRHSQARPARGLLLEFTEGALDEQAEARRDQSMGNGLLGG